MTPLRTRAPSILIVEDQLDALDFLCECFEDAGYVIHRAESGSEALRILRSGERIDVLITDYSMPGMTGTALIHQARHEQLLRDTTPVLICTAYPNVPAPADVAVLRKPVRPAALIASVEGALAFAARRAESPAGEPPESADPSGQCEAGQTERTRTPGKKASPARAATSDV
ncbi:MAG TPA: response regulator [Polyangiaceae bacterium]